MILLDFETRSKLSIKAGASKYSKHAEILCLSYSLDGGKTVRSWQPGDANPQDLIVAAMIGDEFHAHNAAFEIQVWQNICVPRYGWPEIDLTQWRCTMAECLASNLPPSLEQSAAALELPVEKDMKGRRLMLKMSKPRKPTKNDKSLWHEKPEDLARLTEYCDQDVRTEGAVHDAIPRLIPSEIDVFHLDQKINSRGVRIDRELAEAAVDVWKKHIAKLEDRLAEITFGAVKSVGEVANMREALHAYGYPVVNLRKETVEAALKDSNCTGLAREILSIRFESAKTSVKKYERMLLCAEEDDRIRGVHQYHGASQTGRFAGRMVQLQNLPRGKIDEKKINWIAPLVALAKKRDLDLIEQKSPMDMGDLLSSLLRPTIIAEPGHRLLVCDYASIEARALAWLAGEKWLLEAFAKGEDSYIHMASDIYGVPYKEVTKAQRFTGKQAILGCFTADTLVLTDTGWKPIVNVTLSDKLWDGEEWVEHLGPLYQGKKNVLSQLGVSATPDHLCLAKTGWIPWADLTQNPQNLQTAISLANLPSKVSEQCTTAMANGRVCTTKSGVRVEKCPSLLKIIWSLVEQHVATTVQRLHRTKSDTGSTGMQWQTMGTDPAYWTDYQPASTGVTTPNHQLSTTMAAEESRYAKSGGKIGQVFSNMFRLWMAGISRSLKWTGLTTTRGTSLETSGSYPEVTTCGTNGTLQKCPVESQPLKDVWDIACSGPRHRFTILTSQGPIIVHNCGYQLGHKKFQTMCTGYGVDLDLDFCKQVITTYRKKNRAIVRVWYKLEEAAMHCVDKQTDVKCNRGIAFGMRGDWLRMRLPSGRTLGYYKPKIVEGDFGPKIAYTGVDGQSGRAVRTSTYGGKLTENAIQAICRDLLVNGIQRLEEKGYPVIFHVHDEIVCELPEGQGGIDEMRKTMCSLPDWATNFPIDGEGFEARRYRK